MSDNKIDGEVIYEMLKKIQNMLSDHSNALQDLKNGQINIREDVNSLRGDLLRHPMKLVK